MRQQRTLKRTPPNADTHQPRTAKKAKRRGSALRVELESGASIGLDQYDEISRLILAAFETADPVALPACDRPAEVLRRMVYAVGLAYRRAGAVAALRGHVQRRDREFWRAPTEMTENAFFWVVRLVSKPPNSRQRLRGGRKDSEFPGVTSSVWSRHIQVMEKVAAYDIAPAYIGHFVWAMGGWNKAAQTIESLQSVPAWVAALTSAAQLQAGRQAT